MDGYYQSPTYGVLSLSQVKKKIVDFMAGKPEDRYQLVVGSDSQPKNGNAVDFITAIIVHRIGHGGIYFWKKNTHKFPMVLRNRIYQEATLSLVAAENLLIEFKGNGITKYDVEIHVDIGQNGASREMITEVVGMVKGSGFTVKTKPYAYGASKVADRHT